MESGRRTWCAKCRRDLADVIPLDTPNTRERCPDCGATARTGECSFDEAIELADGFSGLGKRASESFAYREANQQGQASEADLQDDGTADFAAFGTSSQGEDDTLKACEILVAALNERGGSWTAPLEGTGVVDCCSQDRIDPKSSLDVQVVRAVSDPSFWRELNATGQAIRNSVLNAALAKLIEDAIKKKANDRVIPVVSRRDLVLALDATRLPVLGFDAISRQATQLLGRWASELGFASVWLVGPRTELTWRLDVQSEESP